MPVNSRVLGLAESWIGTPYRHQGAIKGVGCDCLGLIRGIWRELYGAEPERVPAYAPDWAERSGEERLLQAAARHFLAVASFEESRPGDLVLFRFRSHLAAKHAGILARVADSDPVGAPNAFIHAYEQSAVIRSALVPGWRRKIAGIYRFPERGF
jgi:NlpC/P60 family putative phage cell wall peptidase